MNVNHSEQSVVFLFAGQGSPVIGMGADIWDINPSTRHIWDCASDITGMDIRRLCLKGPMNRLIQTAVQQVAVTAINVTLYSLYRERIKNSRIVGLCGHSVGEYSALHAAGSITLEALFRLIHFRATLMNDISQTNKGSMLAVKGIGFQNLSQLICRSGLALDISCDNTIKQQVVGGTSADLGDFARQLMVAGYASVKLGVNGAWHTRLMAQGVPLMRDYLAGIEIVPPQYDVLMNVTGLPEYGPSEIKENLALHLTQTVKWTDSMVRLLELGPPVFFVEFNNKAYLGQMLNDFAGFTPERAVHCRKV